MARFRKKWIGWRSAGLFVASGALILSLGVSNLGGPAEAAQSDISAEEAEGIIFERQQLMLAIDADAKIIGEIVAGLDKESDLGKSTRSLAENAAASVTAFETVLPGGRSKPEVWSSHDAFMVDMRLFAENAEKMAVAGEQGDLNGVINLMIDAMPCKQCHDKYRTPKSR